MPQIEVTFDIDANGILTSRRSTRPPVKEQSIRIEIGLLGPVPGRGRAHDASEAEANADSDKRAPRGRRPEEPGRPPGAPDRQVSSSEHKDKLEEADITAIEAAKDELAEAAKGDDKAKIEAALQAFQQKAQKLGEVIYKAAQDEQQDGQGAPADGATAGASDDEPVDADFEVKS